MFHPRDLPPATPALAVDGPEFDPRWLRFQRRRDERRFQADRRESVTQTARIFLFLVAGAALLGAVIDHRTLDGHEALEVTGQRVGAALFLVLFALILRRPRVQRRLKEVLLAGAVGIHGFWFASAIHLGAEAAPYVGVAPINLMLTFLAFGLPFRLSVWVAGAAGLGYLAAVPFILTEPAAALIYIVSGGLFSGFAAYSAERAKRQAWAEAQALAAERARSEELLLNVLPPSIAGRMKAGERLIADRFEEAGVLFADIVGFTQMSAQMDPAELVDMLDEIFRRFDAIAARRDLEKIKTIGDCYMLACGLPRERRSDPARIVEAALEMHAALHQIAKARGRAVDIRIGAHAGPVVAGVIGQSKFIYDLWGDTVNVASRMESTAPKGGIQISAALAAKIGRGFALEDRGEVELKGRGPMQAYLVLGPGRRARGASAARAVAG